VIAVSRTRAAFPEFASAAGSIQQELADAGEATAAARLLDRHAPSIVIVVAGATPHMRSLQEQTWETFSLHWQADVRVAFHWLREILLNPLRPGSRVVVVSSGAAVGGSPLSGGYAGAKAMQRFMTGYAQAEARRAGLDITFTAVLPRFAPETAVGQAAVRAYATRGGQSVQAFLDAYRQSMGPPVTPEIAGSALIDLVTSESTSVAPGYLLTGSGLQTLP
jgi:hypothetical protein